jgi:hypothetical protein
MRKLSTVLLLVALMTACAWAFDAKEEVVLFTEDASPNLGPVAPASPIDTPWDTLFTFRAETGATNLLLGAAHAGGYFWASGGGVSSGVTTDNKYYRYNNSGVIIDSFPQPTNSGWGWRDLAYDGTYLYAGCETATVVAFNPATGALVPGMDFPKAAAAAIVRALAYDPTTDHFWTGNFGSNIIEMDRSGNLIWSGSPAPLTSVYGMAWDNDPSGPWLWIFDQGTPGCVFHKWNPITHTFVGESHALPLMPGNTAGIAGGAELANTWNSAYWTMVSMVQGTPTDQVCVTELRNNANPLAPGAPTNWVLSNNGATLMASLSWTNPTVTVNGSPLLSIDNVIVKRNGAIIATLTGTPGQAMTYNDNVPSVGSYSYQVYATNSSGDGIPVGGSAWIGLDTPGPATGVVATPGNMSYTLNWVAPAAGQHGGYFPPGSWTGQKIYRNAMLVATLTGTNTSYSGTVPAAGTYTLGVAYYNTSGDGPTVNAAPIFISGPPQYTVSTTPYNWVEINPNRPGGLPGINTGLNGDDQNLGPFPIGFNFPFFSGTTFNSVRMCSNGWASFTSTATVYVNVTIPTAAEPNNLLAVYWDDMYMVPSGGGGAGFYYYDAANSRFIMEWDTIEHFSSTVTGDTFTFQIILYTNGTIDYMYKDLVPGTTTPYPSATIGIEDATGALGNLATFDGSGPINPTPMSGIRFTPAGSALNLDIVLDPVSPPIVIPPGGGSFNFNATLTNNATTPATFQAWIKVQLPNGSWYGPVLGPLSLTLPGSASISRLRTQAVPGSAPAGAYVYRGWVGNYPSNPVDSSSFPFTKSAVGLGGNVSEWVCYGEAFPGEMVSSIMTPSSFSLNGATPNPFNPTTTISFTLPEVSRVHLNVYDMSGRLVTTLVNGQREAGSHQVTFDGSNMASGIYLYTLTAGSHSATGKMVLLK